MRELTTIYKNNDEAAHDIFAFIQSREVPRFSLRPFNHFDTANTEWWFIPGSEWPAYKYGKLCLHRYPREAGGVLYAGYYIEKGLDSKLAGLPDVQKSNIMQDDWYWHEFIAEASAKKIGKVIKESSKRAGTSVRILMEIHAFNKVPKVGTARSIPSDTIEFEIRPPDWNWHLIQAGNVILSQFNKVAGVTDLLKQLSKKGSDLDYFWLDCVIGMRVQYGNDSSHSWKAPDLWTISMEPWLEFVH